MKFMNMNKKELKKIVAAVGLSSIGVRCSDIARRIDSQEQKIDMMDYSARELKWENLTKKEEVFRRKQDEH